MLRAFYGDGTGGEREALQSALDKVLRHFEPKPCDSDGIDQCVRCGAVYLARSVQTMLNETRERAEAEIAVKRAKEKSMTDQRGDKRQRTFEALLKHPRPMGRPFMHRWYGPIQADTEAAAVAAAKSEARLTGFRYSKIREITDGKS